MRISKAQESAIIERVARYLCEEEGDSPDDPEPGNFPKKDGKYQDGEAWHFRWRDFSQTAEEIVSIIQNFPRKVGNT